SFVFRLSCTSRRKGSHHFGVSRGGARAPLQEPSMMQPLRQSRLAPLRAWQRRTLCRVSHGFPPTTDGCRQCDEMEPLVTLEPGKVQGDITQSPFGIASLPGEGETQGNGVAGWGGPRR